MPAFLRRAVTFFVQRVLFSLAGWRAAWASETSLRMWFGVCVVSGVAALLVPLETGARAAIIGLGVMILAAELLNTAIEEAVDDISTTQRARARKAKDCASAGVALTVIATAAAWAVGLWGLATG